MAVVAQKETSIAYNIDAIILYINPIGTLCLRLGRSAPLAFMPTVVMFYLGLRMSFNYTDQLSNMLLCIEFVRVVGLHLASQYPV